MTEGVNAVGTVESFLLEIKERKLFYIKLNTIKCPSAHSWILYWECTDHSIWQVCGHAQLETLLWLASVCMETATTCCNNNWNRPVSTVQVANILFTSVTTSFQTKGLNDTRKKHTESTDHTSPTPPDCDSQDIDTWTPPEFRYLFMANFQYFLNV